LEKTVNGHEMEIHAHFDVTGDLVELHLWCYSHPEGESVFLVPVDGTYDGAEAGQILLEQAELHAQGEINVDSSDQ